MRLVSASGIAELYSAVDPLLRRRVAIKVLSERLAADAAKTKRFARNALAAARLIGEQHVVTIYEVGEDAGRPFIVMEFLTGGSLEDVLREGGVHAPGTVIPWLEQAARALDWAHEQGLVHGDVKPSNLLFDEAGHVHVTDFGLVEAVAPDTDIDLESASMYRAPEQAHGLNAGGAADQYALALVGLELLTGSRVRENEWPGSHGLPVRAGAVFDRALATRPGDRFESCNRFAAALGAAFADEGRATAVLPAPPASRRNAWPTRVQTLIGLLLLIAGGVAAAIAATHHAHGSATAVPATTLSRPGPTVRETVTADAPSVTVHDTVTVLQTVTASAGTTTPVTPAPATTTPTPGGSSASLALAGYRRLQRGDATGALPYLRAAAARLDGTHTLAEAYNDYNLALAITKIEGCGTVVSQLLEESESIQGHRTEIDHLRQACGGRQ